MALLADDAKDRAEQLVLVTERLAVLVAEDTRRIEARLAPLDGAEGDEKARLANTYRLELTRIKHDRSLVEGAPPGTLERLKVSTVALHETLAAHELALGAIKLVSEGLVHAMAEEVSRQRSGEANYAQNGGLAAPTAPAPTVIDRNA
jgi:acetyl-CoA acetyltransferase